jgi:glycosyltransferase involved in cell wall biosynthesis
MKPLSAVLITRNEAENLEATLHALAWCNEILIVDSGSTDATQSIAESFGAKFIVRDFQGFGPQKRFAVSQAKYDWVLCLDADEVLSADLQREIQELRVDDSVKGYRLKRQLVFLNRPFRYGRESKEYHLRLFDRRFGNFDEAMVHEMATVKGEVRDLNAVLLHYSYPNTQIYFRKFNEYTEKASLELFQRGKNRNPWINILSLPVNFLFRLIVHGNILNGYPGWIWSLYSAFYPVVKYTKVWERNKNK